MRCARVCLAIHQAADPGTRLTLDDFLPARKAREIDVDLDAAGAKAIAWAKAHNARLMRTQEST